MKLSLENLRSLIKEAIEEQKKTMLIESPQILDEEDLEEASIRKNPHPFKAIFIFGPAGAGKSFLSKQLGIPKAFKVSNPDERIESVFPAFGLSLKFAAENQDEELFKVQQTAREILQNASQGHTANLLNIANPLVFDTTGENVAKMSKRIEALTAAGYDVAIFQVNVPTETSVERDKARKRTVGEPTKAISQQYQQQVAQDRGYFEKFESNPRVTMLGDDIYANIFDLRDGSLLVDPEVAGAMKTKDGKPFTAEYAKDLLAKAKSDLQGFLSQREPTNPTGAALYDGMMELVSASGGKLGQGIGDFAAAAADENLMSNPKIAKAAEIVASLGGAKAALAKAQRGKKVAGKSFGKASDKDATFGSLGLREEELSEQVKEIIRSILLTKEE